MSRVSEPYQIRFWKIEEAVGAGLYIPLGGIYTTTAAAEEDFPYGGECRAVEYQRGRNTDGPERVK